MKAVWRNFGVVFILLFSGLLGLLLGLFQQIRAEDAGYDSTNKSQSQVNTRKTFHSPAIFVRQLQGDSRAGEKIFYTFCATCHANHPQIAIAAPRIGDKNFWENIKKFGIDKLLKFTINGRAAMPARGGCFECSDEQLQKTIEYIIDISGAK